MILKSIGKIKPTASNKELIKQLNSMQKIAESETLTNQELIERLHKFISCPDCNSSDYYYVGSCFSCSPSIDVYCCRDCLSQIEIPISETVVK